MGIGEAHALIGQAIQVRGRDFAVGIVASHVPIPHVICKYVYNIGFALFHGDNPSAERWDDGSSRDAPGADCAGGDTLTSLASLILAVDVFSVLNSENQDALLYDHKDDAVVTDAKLAHPCKGSTQGGEPLWIVDELFVDPVQNPFRVGLTNAFEIFPNGLLVIHPIVQETQCDLKLSS